MSIGPPNNSMKRTVLRAAADAHRTDRRLSTAKAGRPDGPVNQVGLSADGELIVTASDDVSGGKLLASGGRSATDPGTLVLTRRPTLSRIDAAAHVDDKRSS